MGRRADIKVLTLDIVRCILYIKGLNNKGVIMFKTIILVVALTFACLAGDAKIYAEDGTYLGKLNDNKYDAE